MIERSRRAIARRLAEKLKPRPRITGLEYAEQYGYVTGGAESRGKWHTRPYQRDWFLAVTDPMVECLVCQKPARVGWSEFVKIGFVQFFCHWRPSKIMLVQPTDDEVKKYSREDIDPLFDPVDGAPCLRGLLSNRKSKTTHANTYNFKQLSNGALIDIRNAATPKSMRRVERGVIGIEEPAAFDKIKEGDAIDLILKRAGTINNPFFTIGGTPVEPNDYMDQSFKKGDQQYRYYPCPHCRTYQQLAWDRFIKEGPDAGKVECIGCDQLIEYRHLRRMDDEAGWACPLGLDRSRQILRDGMPVWRSQQVGVGASYHRDAAWTEIVQRYANALAQLKMGNPDPMQTFHNTDLGVPWEDSITSKLTAEGLSLRRQDTGAGNGYLAGTVPNGVLMVTAGADVQGGGETEDQRLVVSFWGWGHGEEAWHLGHFEIDGDPQQAATLDQLDELAAHQWVREDGRVLRMALGGIDDGGLSTHEVRNWCRTRASTWAPMKGNGRSKAKELVSRGTMVDINWRGQLIKRGVKIYIVDYDESVTLLRNRLRVEQPGPRYLHFGEAASDQFLAELFPWKRRPQRDSRGQTTYRWTLPRGEHDEGGDCTRMAYAALQVMARRYTRGTMWDQLERSLGGGTQAEAALPLASAGGGSGSRASGGLFSGLSHFTR
jgi:phage terminase large subunit GpA-like protein